MNENEVIADNMTRVWFQLTDCPYGWSRMMTQQAMEDRFYSGRTGWHLVSVTTIVMGESQILMHTWQSGNAALVQATWTTVTPAF